MRLPISDYGNTNLHPISYHFSYHFEVIAEYCSIFGQKTITAFLSPSLRSLETMYAVHLRLIRKRVVDFLFVLIELFSLGVTAKVLRANIDRKSAFLHKISGRRDRPHQPFFLSENYMNRLFTDVRTLAVNYFVLAQCTRLTYRQTDRQTNFDRKTARLHSQSRMVKYIICKHRYIHIRTYTHNRSNQFS